MKKSLLGSASLFALAFTGSAHAQLDLNITGSVDVNFGIVDESVDINITRYEWECDEFEFGPCIGGAIIGPFSYSATFSPFERNYGGRSDFTINLELDGVTDNGLEYGARVNIDDTDGNRRDSRDNTTLIVDEAWIYVSGSFGEFRLGDDEGAFQDLGAIGVPSVGTGLADGDWPNYVGEGSSLGTTGLSDNDATRIQYIGTFDGFQVSASFAPSQESRLGDPGLGEGEGDTIEIGANYTLDFTGGSFLIAGGIAWGDSGVPGIEDLFEYVIGLRVSYNNLTVGGFYLNSGDSYSPNFSAGEGADDTERWGVGATYRYDGLTVGANFLYASFGQFGPSNDCIGGEGPCGPNFFDADFEAWAAGIGAEYALFPGFSPYVEVVFFNEEFNVSDAFGEGEGVETSGTVVLVGATASW